MRMVDIIEKKRDGYELSETDIRFVIENYTKEIIPEYQMSAFLMAIYFQGMSSDETAYLTKAMIESGDQIDLSSVSGVKVDKHSTGGVGDTTTLILAPLVAAVGVSVAKMSGRGLGHTGGTIDKLESIAGFHVELSQKDFIELVNKNQLAVVGQSGNLTPADKKIYSLRDVTATVDSIPLIASSIMSKKIAAGADAIVLDVKVGAGAFMKSQADAKRLAETMVKIGTDLGRNTVAVLSNMDQPLGYAIGNALEMKEAIETLKGNGPKDLHELCIVLGSKMVVLANKASTEEEARMMLEQVIENGQALNKLKQLIASQGGDETVVDDESKLPQAKYETPVTLNKEGYISGMIADEIGIAASMLGAGRTTKEAEIDLSVGIVLHKKIGDYVKENEKVATIYSHSLDIDEAQNKVIAAYEITDKQPMIPKLIIG